MIRDRHRAAVILDVILDVVDNQCLSSSALSQHRLKSAASSPAAKLRDYCTTWQLWFSVVPAVASPSLALIGEGNFRNRNAPRYQRCSGEPASFRASPTRGLADICKPWKARAAGAARAARLADPFAQFRDHFITTSDVHILQVQAVCPTRACTFVPHLDPPARQPLSPLPPDGLAVIWGVPPSSNSNPIPSSPASAATSRPVPFRSM